MEPKYNPDAYTKVFNDPNGIPTIVFEGKVFDEKALYKKEDPNWEVHQRWQGWMRAKPQCRKKV